LGLSVFCAATCPENWQIVKATKLVRTRVISLSQQAFIFIAYSGKNPERARAAYFKPAKLSRANAAPLAP